MDAHATRVRRKNIDIKENVFQYLSIKAAASGTNLKHYIEMLLEKEVENMDENSTYEYLCKTRPEGNVALNEQETVDFEKWLDV